jgi:hypothetical protein
MKTALVIVACWAVLEFFLWLLFSWLRAGCQWLIMERDERPLLDRKALNKFLDGSYDPELGWVRKPFTKGIDKGKNGALTEFTIDKSGARSNPGFESRAPEILVFGDSYAFCRQVNDDETWPHLVSKTLNRNVRNFGVGNYGLDQAILRMKRELSKQSTSVVLITVVPETICRVQTVWKHYSEYGNTFGFKPRFKIEDDCLVHIKNIMDDRRKFYRYQDFLSELQPNDYFYKNKFRRDILKFPYTLSFGGSIMRNAPLIMALLDQKFNQASEGGDKPKRLILERNHSICMKLYKDPRATYLLEKLVLYGRALVEQEGSEFMFCLIPQLQDLQLVQRHGIYYQSFLDRLAASTHVLDLTTTLMRDVEFRACYINDQYGGHLSRYGNEVVASVIARKVSTIIQEKVCRN